MAAGVRGGAVLLTNGATPYRSPVFDLVARQVERFTVVYDRLVERGRQWQAGALAHDHRVWSGAGRRVDLRDLIGSAALIVTHLNPRSIGLGALVAASGGEVIYFSDGGAASERELDAARRLVRHALVRRFDRFIAGTPDVRSHLVLSFGVEPERIFSSYLCPLSVFRPARLARRFDVVLGGRDVEEKNHAFALEVCVAVARRGRLNVAVFGELGRRTSLDSLEREPNVTVSRFGHLAPAALAELFAASRVFLMPSVREPWGLALHEALRCGCAAIAAPAVTSARYLESIYRSVDVVPLEQGAWCSATARRLREADCRDELIPAADTYSLEAAAGGIAAAIAASTSAWRQRKKVRGDG